MRKRHITLSVILHAAVVAVFLFAAGLFVKGNKNSGDENVLTVSISGDPSKQIGGKYNSAQGLAVEQNKISGGQGGGTGFNVKDSYSGAVLKKIYENKYYPLAAKKQNLSGSAVLNFTVDRKGEIIGFINVNKSSGSIILDQAAINAVNNSQPFGELPQDIKDKELTFTVNMDFVPSVL